MNQNIMRKLFIVTVFTVILSATFLYGDRNFGVSADKDNNDMDEFITGVEAEIEHEPEQPPLHLIKLPYGFHIELYAEGVASPRAMALSPNNTVFVGSFGAGNIYALRDHDRDMFAEDVVEIEDGLKMPVGLAFWGKDLYVSGGREIWKYEDIERTLKPDTKVLITGIFPDDHGGYHGWKFIDFGPDGKLYVPQGAPCNICEEDNPLYSSITRMNPDGSDLEVYAAGIRNSVGFAWHPVTKELWFTDNGRDELGDDIPPDELNYAPKPGMHFGFPYCHGEGILEEELEHDRACGEFTPPAQQLGPHVASLGMTFYDGQMFPEEYRNNIFIAEHGSWNRSKLIGYRITRVKIEGNKAVSYEVFAEGWLQGQERWGRPVDVLVMPDGSLLVSDDYGDRIFRITYNAPQESEGG